MSDERLKKYDVFISYRWIEPDQSWVRNKLCPALKAAGLNVLLDVESFAPGRDMMIEMEQAVSSSSKAICVFSPDYFEGNRMGDFENLMIRRSDPSGIESRFIPVVLRPANVPDRFRGLIPIDWTNPDNIPREWGKLLKVLNATNLNVPPPLLHEPVLTSPATISRPAGELDGKKQFLIEQEIKKIHVDRVEQIELFGNMIRRQSKTHVLLIKAEEFMGKSSLLNIFWEMSSKFKRARLDLRQTSLSVCDILARIAVKLGEESFSNLRFQLQSFYPSPKFDSSTSLESLCSFAENALNKQSRDDQEMNRKMITDAFILDFLGIYNIDKQPIVILFDTFEKAGPEIMKWMSNQLLKSLRVYPWLNCVVAGRQTPEIDLEEEADWCVQHELVALPDKYAREYIAQVKLPLGEKEIDLIILLAKGKPSNLQTSLLMVSQDLRNKQWNE
jgi:hypothetical protein